MQNSRIANARLNMISGLLQEVVALLCGLILPRVILVHFGSTYNGIVNSVVQFLSFSAVLRSGLGSATHAALYKPLADKNNELISGIMVATDNFMKKVGLLLAAIIVAFASVYPFAVKDEFGYLFSFSLVIIIGISTFAENMFSVKYKILLQADQKYYIQTFAVIGTQILSTVVSIVLIYMNCSIHIVRLGGALSYFSTPLFLNGYVKKHYCINWKTKANNNALKQRWNAFALQLAIIVNNNVDTVIMTLLVSLKEISVYTVYYMVVHNINKLISSSISGFKAIFGDMIAKGEKEHLKRRFQEIEWLVFAGSAVIFSVTAIMLTPFVLLYTRNVEDVDYNRYIFGIVMVSVHMLTVLRVPFQQAVEAAGHFKETRNGAILEVVFNIVFSLVFAYIFGILGVLIGTAVAAIIRTIQFGVYACKNVVKVSIGHMVKNYLVYFGISSIMVLLGQHFIPNSINNYFQWLCFAITVFLVCCVIVGIISLIFNYKQFNGLIVQTIKRRKKT